MYYIYFNLYFQRKHRDVYINLQAPAKSVVPSIATSSDGGSMRSFLCSNVRYSSSDPRQKKITDALVSFIATDLLPLSLVESSSFRNLVGLLDPKYSVPSRKHFSQTLLTNKVSDVERRLKTQLQQAQSVCLTIDLWSSRQMRGYMGVTGHFILNWTLHSVLLSCSRFDAIQQRISTATWKKH